MAHIDITDKIGFALLKKGVIDYETLEKSLKVKESEERKNRRNLGQILVNDFNADHDAVFREVADLYAFREIYLADEKIDEVRIDFIRKYVESIPESVREMLLQTKMLPLKFDDKQSDKLIIVASDPTDRRIPLIARSFGAKKYEVAYCRIRDLLSLLEQVIPPEKVRLSTWSRAHWWRLSGRARAIFTSSRRRETGQSSGSGLTGLFGSGTYRKRRCRKPWRRSSRTDPKTSTVLSGRCRRMVSSSVSSMITISGFAFPSCRSWGSSTATSSRVSSFVCWMTGR
jgi:hypothetical protein